MPTIKENKWLCLNNACLLADHLPPPQQPRFHVVWFGLHLVWSGQGGNDDNNR